MSNYSVVIVARDTQRPLLGTLLALRKWASPGEVLLIDNASDGDLSAVVAISQLDIRLLRTARHESLGVAFNAGLDCAKYDAVLLLHSDVVLESDPQLGVDFLLGNDDVGVIGGKLFYDGSPPRRVRNAGYEVGPGRVGPRPIGHGEWDRWHTIEDRIGVSNACMLVRRRPDLRFDERYWFGLEDIDLCLQYRQRGYRVALHPGMVAVHLACAGVREARKDAQWAARELASRWLYHERWCTEAPLADLPRMEAVRGTAATQYLKRADTEFGRRVGVEHGQRIR